MAHVTSTESRAGDRTMKAAVFVEPGRIVLDEKPIPRVGPLDALLRVTTTTICGTDVHILKGEYPVARGLTVGHEPVGVIEDLGTAVTGYELGQRVIAGNYAMRPMPCMPQRRPSSMWRQGDGRLAAWEYYRRVPGRVRPHSRCHGQSGSDSQRPHG